MGLKRAVILFADILGSTELASTLMPQQYSDVLRSYHTMTYGVTEKYRKENRLGSDRLIAGSVGDECHIFLVGGLRDEDECHALQLAVELKRAWASSLFGRNLSALARNLLGARVNLRIGVGCGDVVFASDIWTGLETPEGIYISQAKRIESLAEQYAPETYILVKLDIKEAAERRRLPITFGDRVSPIAKGFSRGNIEVPLYPVLSWHKLQDGEETFVQTPEIPYDFFNLAFAQQRNGNMEDAINTYGRAITLYRELYSAEYTDAWNNLGTVFYISGRYDDAINAYNRIIANEPNDVETLHNLGMVYAAKGRLDDAIATYQRALEIDSEFAKAWNGLAMTYLDKGLFSQALLMLKEAENLDPDQFDIIYNRACVYAKKGDLVESITELNRIFTIDPVRYVQQARKDLVGDLKSLRDLRGFRELLERFKYIV